MQRESLSEVIRYEEDIKRKMQETDNLILEANRTSSTRQTLSCLIQEEEVLFKYLEIESSKMSPDVLKIYSKNVRSC